MATWTIKGEAGRGLDATVRTFDALGVDSALLEFNRLGSDAFSFGMTTIDPTGTGIDGVNRIPTLGQIIELYRDGVRKFRGHAVQPEVDLSRVSVRVEGAGWWMAKIPLSATASGTLDTGTDATGERPAYVFPTQSLRTSLQALVNRMVTLGVPMQSIPDADVADRISTMFNVLKTTLSGNNGASALAELMCWMPDAVDWYDYSGSGAPALNITRRGDMATLTLTVGSNMPTCRIKPRLDLEVARTELHYVTRNPTSGLPRWARQSYGTATPGKIQMVPVSGPDLATLVPPDDFDTTKLKTREAKFTLNDAFQRDAFLADTQKQYGGFAGYSGTWDFDGWHLIISGQTADWMRKDYGLETKDVQVQGIWNGMYLSSTGLGGCADYLKSLGMLTWTTPVDGIGTFKLKVDFTATVINLSYPLWTTVYKKWDYDYLTPPASLAQNLQGTQNWVPWEGTIVIVGDEVTGNNDLNRKIRVSGGQTASATMDALCKSVSHDILNKRTTYNLGVPARTDFGSMVSRIRRQPSDNIVYL